MNGIIVIDKPKGATSFTVVRKIKKLSGVKKVGHTGTLDPLATGVLPICIGEATKASDFIMEGDKTYEVRFKLGERTNTLDADGEIIATGINDPLHVDKDALLEVVYTFIGEVLQTPPMYSAIKKDGVPLYKLARNGEEVDREKRKITIYKISLLKFELPYVELSVDCSKGTYIRTLVDDIGERLGTYAHVTELRRTKNGIFNIKDCIKLTEQTTTQDIIDHVIPIEDFLKRIMPVVEVDNDTAHKIANGYMLDLGLKATGVVLSKDSSGHNKLVSINDAKHTLRVFNYQEWK